MSRRTSVKRPEGAKSKDTGVNHVEDVPEVVQPREIKRAKAAAGGSPVAPAATAKAVPASSPVATKPSYVNTRRSIFAPHLQRLTRAEKIITSALASTLFTKKIPLYGPAPSVSEDGIALVPVDESDGSVPPTDTVFYVKWKRLSHVHCCWVTRAVVECSDPHAQRLAIAEKFGLMEYCPVGLVSASAPVKPASRDSDVSDSESEEDIDDDISIQASITSCELGDPVAGVGEVTGDDLEHVDALLTSARKGSRMMLRNFLNSDAAEDSMVLDDVAELTQVERVVNKRELTLVGGGVSGVKELFILVKWDTLTYDQCTWEWAHDPALISAQASPSGVRDALLSYDTWNAPPTPEQLKWREAANKAASAIIKDPVAARQSVPGRFKPLNPAVTFPLRTCVAPSVQRLRSYQVEGVNWMLSSRDQGRNVILADEMGLGKTAQIASLLEIISTGNTRNITVNGGWNASPISGPFLIIAPLSTLGHWRRELATWTALNAIVYNGDAVSRDVIFKQEWFYSETSKELKFDVLITTPQMVKSKDPSCFARLKSITWQALIVDEGHSLKDYKSQLYEAVFALRAASKILLTGTPIQNSQSELWSLLHLLHPENPNIGELSDWLSRFARMGSAQLEVLTQLMTPFLLRRSKFTALKDLPPLTEKVIYVELTTLQKVAYKAIYERNAASLIQGDTKKSKDVATFQNMHMEFRKCCNHPFLVKTVKDGERSRLVEEGILAEDDTVWPSVSDAVTYSGKMVLLKKFLPHLKKEGHKVLIFSQFKIMLDLIEDFLIHEGYLFERIDGGVTGSNRQAAIDRFESRDATLATPQSPSEEADDAPFVFLLTTKSGGQGINLQSADTVILFDSDWNPQNDLQAQARCHRIGQSKPVSVYRLITNRTYESEMFDRAGMKLGNSNALLKQSERHLNGFVDASSEGKSQAKAAEAEELELLLKKGAYYAIKDRDDSKQFCDEDILSILTTRTRNVSGGTSEGTDFTASLSAVSFASDGGDTLSVDDPQFWTKVYGGAVKLRAAKKLQEEEEMLARGRVRKQTDRLYSSIEEEKKVRKATGEPRRERKAGPSAGFVYIDDSEGDEEEEEVEEAPVDVDVEDPDITGDLPILDAAGEPLPKVRKIHGLYESMLRFGLGRWAEIQTAANLQQYPIPVIVAYVRAILSLCSSGLPDAIQANMTLVSFEPLLVLEGVELPTLPTVGEIFSAKWVQAFREEASSVFSRLRMLRDLRSALTNAGFTSLDSLTGEGLAASSFVAPHVRGAMKSCPAWKMSRERDALLLIGIYKHGWPVFRGPRGRRGAATVFDFLKDDTSLPFFPKCTPVDPAASPVKSGGDAEDDVETCTAVDPTTADPSAAEDVPMTGAVDDGWPTTKDFDDRIRSLLTALAREHINTEREIERQKAIELLTAQRQVRLQEQKQRQEQARKVAAVRAAEAKLEAMRKQKELASKRGKWSEPEVDRFLKRFLKVGEPLCAGGQALDWSPLAEGGSDALCVKTVEAMHLFYRSVWLWAGGVYPAAKPLADEVCSLPYLNPDGVPVIVNFSDPTVAAAVDAGVATLRAPDLKKLKLGIADAAQLANGWTKRSIFFRKMVSSGLDATIAAFAALAESGSPATASLYASHPWWVRGQDCAAFVRGLFAKGPGVDALAAIWTDPTFGFAERERVVDKSYLKIGQDFFPKPHLCHQLMGELSAKLSS